MRMGMIAESLSRIAELHVAIVPVAGRLSVPDDLLCRLNARVHQFDLEGAADTSLSLMSLVADPERRLEIFRRYNKPSLTGLVGLALRNRLGALVSDLCPDIVVIGRGYLAHLVDIVPEAARLIIDLDEDDVSSSASQARCIRPKDPVRAQWLMQEADATRRLIDRAMSRTGLALAAAPRDAAALRQRHSGSPVVCVPNAVHLPRARHRQGRGKTQMAPSILFVGALGYEPNIRGLLWFCRVVLPRLRSVFPTLRLIIAGARPDPRVRRLACHAGIRVIADPVSVAPLYAGAQLVVAPLLDGGGTRIKLIEAAAHGKPAVATPASLAGLGNLPGVRRAPAQADVFARACLLALKQGNDQSVARLPRSFNAAHAIPALAQIFSRLNQSVSA